MSWAFGPQHLLFPGGGGVHHRKSADLATDANRISVGFEHLNFSMAGLLDRLAPYLMRYISSRYGKYEKTCAPSFNNFAVYLTENSSLVCFMGSISLSSRNAKYSAISGLMVSFHSLRFPRTSNAVMLTCAE